MNIYNIIDIYFKSLVMHVQDMIFILMKIYLLDYLLHTVAIF